MDTAPRFPADNHAGAYGGVLSNSELINLWALARRLCPRRCAAYLAWHNITPARLSFAALQAAEWAARHRFPRQAPNEWEGYLPREQERRAEMRRFRAAYLLGSHIPWVVRGALLGGRYRVSGCRPDGQRVELTQEDLAGLTVDLARNSLTAPGRVFDMVAVSELGAVEVTASDGTGVVAGGTPPEASAGRKRGRKAVKKPAVVNAMKAYIKAAGSDIGAKEAKLAALDNMTIDQLVTKFGDPVGAKDTLCIEARDTVLRDEGVPPKR